MSTLIVASAEPRAGRSLIAAAIAYRMGRDGKPVTLARLASDDSAARDAVTFAALEGIVAPSAPISEADVKSLTGELVLEAPPGDVYALAAAMDARVIVVRGQHGAREAATSIGAIITRVPASEVATVMQRPGVIAALPEDRVLAAPSVDEIAAAINARPLVEAPGAQSIERVMIGTVASDAASPYFDARERKCVITRYDKTDIQLAALLTDLRALVLTGGGEPSPYLLDRVRGTRDDITVLLADDETPDVMRAIEGLYGAGRFDGDAKLRRAVELLDEAGAVVSFG